MGRDPAVDQRGVAGAGSPRPVHPGQARWAGGRGGGPAQPAATWTSALARQVAADLPAFAALARAHDALLQVDDAHGFGVIGERDGYEPSPFGRSGNAIVRFFGESYDQVVLAAGFSKAYSSLLAFVACPTR
jgi:hypothetical protein